MVKFANLLSRLNSVKILVIGDILFDSYTIGKAKRISPEAPVVVVNVEHEEHRPGGAGNVILNLLSLGAEVTAIGRVGNDWAGEKIKDALSEENVNITGIVTQGSYPTPIKNRIIANNQQIVRIDNEQVIPLEPLLEQKIKDQLSQIFDGIQVVAISDYGKGFLTPSLLSSIFEFANKKEIPVITDPKGNNFSKYKGTTLIKPNLSEAYAAANLPSTAPLQLVASEVLNQTHAELLMVTRSEAGISLFDDQERRFDFPVQAKAVKDVTGAGDTVLAMLSFAIGNQLSYEEAAQLCNIAAGIAIERVGCARVTLSDLAIRLFEHHSGHKIFDQEHLFILQEVLKKKPYNLLILQKNDLITVSLFHAIKSISNDDEDLVLYVEEIDPKECFVDMLASLREVSFIIVKQESLKELCKSSAPKMTYHFCQNQLISHDYELAFGN